MMPPVPAAQAYPRAHVVDVAQRDGSTVHIRPVSPRDGPVIRALLESLSEQSRALPNRLAGGCRWPAAS
jgi:hypothetical protein